MQSIDNEIASEKNVGFNINRRKELLKKGIVVINEIFRDSMLERVYFDIQQVINDKTKEKVQVYINSDGGSVYCMFPLADLIESSKKPVETIIVGRAFSAGAIMALCGTKGYRKANKNAFILLHQLQMAYPWPITNVDLEFEMKHVTEIDDKMRKILKQKTKLTNVDMKHYLERNVDDIIDSQKALKLGIIDEII